MARTFKVVTVGAKESGKTSYAAVLYNYLTVARPAPGIIISSSDEPPWIRQAFSTLVDDSVIYANPPHSALRRVRLQCSVLPPEEGAKRRRRHSPRQRSYQPFEIEYVDYPGEWIDTKNVDDSMNELRADFVASVKTADALICAIDGVALLHLMCIPPGTPAESAWMNSHIVPLLGLALSRAKMPVYFMITKWDIVRPHYHLPDIATRLLEGPHPGLRNFIERRGAQPLSGAVRLIPVSSFGDAGAFVDGHAAIRKGAYPMPVNVMVPIASALVDIAEAALEELRQDQNATDRARKVSKKSADAVLATAGDAIHPTEKGKFKAKAFGIEVDIGKMAAFVLDKSFEAAIEVSMPSKRAGRAVRRHFRDLRSSNLTSVRSDEAAMFYIARMLRDFVETFEQDPQFAGSRLFGVPERL